MDGWTDGCSISSCTEMVDDVMDGVGGENKKTSSSTLPPPPMMMIRKDHPQIYLEAILH